MTSDRPDPEPVHIDGWAYYIEPPAPGWSPRNWEPPARPGHDPAPPLSPPPPAPRSSPGSRRSAIVAGAFAVIAVLALAVGGAVFVFDQRSEGEIPVSDDHAQIETALRRFLLLTSVDEFAYQEVVCAAFREKYTDLIGPGALLDRPKVLSVETLFVRGDTARAQVIAIVDDLQEYAVYDLRREDGRWKACPLDG